MMLGDDARERLLHFLAGDGGPESLFGRLAQERGYVTAIQVEECLREQERLRAGGEKAHLGQILFQRGHLPADRLLELVVRQNPHLRICPACGRVYDLSGHPPGVRLRCLACGDELTGASEVNTTKDIAGSPVSGETRTRLGKYRILREIGRGGMAVVYEAHDPELDRRIALKVLRESEADPYLIERLHREAAIAAQLQHPNIVGIHEVGMVREGGGPPVHFIAMDYVDGRTLAGILVDRRTALPDLLRILEEVARAVAHAHSKGVIHRDLKPANILVSGGGRVILTDFGLAHSESFRTQLTRSRAVMGTPQYMAPEQVEGKQADIDARTDVYALGVILYEMLTGKTPHSAETAARLYQMILYDDPTRPTGPEDLVVICMKAIEKSRGRRYANAKEFADDLERSRCGEPILAKPSSLLTRIAKRLRRHPAVSATAGISLAAVLAAGVYGAVQSARRGGAERKADEERRERARLEERQKEAVPFYQSGLSALGSAESRYRVVGEKLENVQTDLDRAIEMFSRAIGIHAGYAEAHHGRGRTHLLLFRMLRRAQDYERALADLDRAIFLNDRYTTAYFDRARLRLALYRLSRGIQTVRPSGPELIVGRLPPEDAAARALREEAQEDLRRLRELSPTQDEVRFARVALTYAESRFDELIEAASAALEGGAFADEVYMMRGAAHFTRREFREAEADFGEAVKRRPNDPAACRQRADARMMMGMYDGAIEDCTTLFRLSPTADVLVKRASAYRWRGDLDAAERDIEEALKLDKNFAEAYSLRSFIKRLRRDWKGALADIIEALRLQPDDAVLHFNRGNLYQIMGRVAEALADYQRALDRDAELWTVYVNRGVIWYSQGKYQQAADDATEGLKHSPGNADALYNRGNAFLMLQRYDEAIVDFTKAIKARPGVPDMHYNRGLAYRRRGDFDPAVADYAEAIRLGEPGWPELWKPYMSRGRIEFDLGQYKEAVKDLEKAIELNSSLRPQLEPMLEEARKKAGGGG